jgi:acetoacetate decarboxylase
MKKQEVINQFCTPISNPAYPRPPYSFKDREMMIIEYETDIGALKRVVPEPLKITKPVVKYEFMKFNEATGGFGSYCESGQVIPVEYNGVQGNYVHTMYVDSFEAVATGREIFGFQKVMGSPSLESKRNHMLGELHYDGCLVARGTMSYKYNQIKIDGLADAMKAPNYLIKKIPNVDGSPRICELISCQVEDIEVVEAWSSPARLELFHHVRAQVADLPIKKILSGSYFKLNIVFTLDGAKVVYDYLA